ncbi:MAG TPA: heparinase II/III-family protein [Devosiaceae bacterium]|jgi:hypothetical protein
MRLGWYINRLRSMEPAEVLHRLLEKRRQLASRHRHEGWSLYPAAALHPVLPGLRQQLETATPEQRQAIRLATDGTLSGHFAALGRQWPPRDPAALFPADLWRLDPVSGSFWPGAETYAFDIDFRHDGSRGDIKYVWEINRLQMLPALATHALLEGDTRAPSTIAAIIASWHAANPPFRGVGWSSGIEVALRAISLIVTLEIAGDQLDTETRNRTAEILAASAYWLPRFPSRYSSANNHLVAELAGRYLIGLALGQNDPVARADLIAEIDRQILPDGAGAEQTPTYAAFTAELALLCALAARQGGEPFPAEFTDRLAAFADFIAWLGPSTAPLGDDDEGRVLTLGHEPDYSRSVSSAISGFLARPGITPAPADFRTMVFGSPAAAIPTPAGLRTFPQGGLSAWHGEMQGRHLDLTLDHGPLGYLSIAAHGHADALSLTLGIDGIPILVDPGTFLYGSGRSWRDWFRSTPAHNTLNIDGVSQSTISGAFNWSHKAVATLVESRDAPDWLLRATHDGYRRRFGCLHQRTVERTSEGIAISDQLIGTAHEAEIEAEIVFQLSPDHRASLDGRTVTILYEGEPVLTMRLPDSAIHISRGGDAPGEGGFVSPHFGLKLAADRVTWRGTIDAAGVTTLLSPVSPA